MPEEPRSEETARELSFPEISELAKRDRLTLAMTLTVVYSFDYEDALLISDAAAVAEGNIEWFRGLLNSESFCVHRPLYTIPDNQRELEELD